MKHKLKILFARVRTWIRAHRKISSALFAAIFIGLALGIYALTDASGEEVARTEPNTGVAEPEEPPKTVASPLTGLQVPAEAANRPVTAIVIENSPDARPQSSLHEAGFVFESIAEGGITRYLAFYQENRPDPIGPVRSLRPYFIDWVLTFDASVAHVGGSATALDQARALGVKSLTQFAYAESYYRTTDRFAPHNVYTDFDRLDALNKRLGFTDSSFDSFPRKAENPVATSQAKTITSNISSFTYQSSFSWDKASNTYLHRMAGKPEKDRETGTRIAPKVVVVAEIPYTIGGDGRYDYDLVGSGKVTVFQDGRAIVGTWEKEARDEQMTFTGDNGDPIRFNPGMVWMTAISPSQEVEYTP